MQPATVRRTLLFALLTLIPLAAAAADMRALVLSSDGSLVMQSVPVPQPGAGEVRIRVRAAGVNPADWKMAARMAGTGSAPVILGLDAAGTIDALGPGVSGWKRGEAVIALVRPPHGAYAQYTIASAANIARKPRTMSFEAASGIPVAGITAWRSLFNVGHLKRGERVLIEGGAGGVGSAAVQIAKAHGAYVIATASTANMPFLRSLGVDEPIDHTAGAFEKKVANVDIVLDTANREVGIEAMGTLKPGGVLVSIVGPMPPERCAAAHIECGMPGSSGDRAAAEFLEDVARIVDAGKYRVSIEHVYPLAEGGRAWALGREGHTRGKIVLAIGR